MNADGAVAFAALPEQVTEGVMNLHRVAVDFHHALESFDGRVGLLVQVVVEAGEVFARQGWRHRSAAAGVPLGEHPSGRGRDRQQQPDQFIHTWLRSSADSERRYASSFSAKLALRR